jgi:hypothetical protein
VFVNTQGSDSTAQSSSLVTINPANGNITATGVVAGNLFTSTGLVISTSTVANISTFNTSVANIAVVPLTIGIPASIQFVVKAIDITTGNVAYTQSISALTDGFANVVSTNYAILGNSLGNITVAANIGSVNLIAAPVSSNTINWTVQTTLI